MFVVIQTMLLCFMILLRFCTGQIAYEIYKLHALYAKSANSFTPFFAITRCQNYFVARLIHNDYLSGDFSLCCGDYFCVLLLFFTVILAPHSSIFTVKLRTWCRQNFHSHQSWIMQTSLFIVTVAAVWLRTAVHIGQSLWHWLNSIWWRHQMEAFSASLALCAGNSPVAGEYPSQRPVTRSFDVFFDRRLIKRLSKQAWGWWF